jgi:hypothetical protein
MLTYGATSKNDRPVIPFRWWSSGFRRGKIKALSRQVCGRIRNRQRGQQMICRWNVFRQPIARRQFLRGLGASFALPLLDAMQPRRARGADESTSPQRFVCVANPFGMINDSFFPTETGSDAKLPTSLEPLETLRGRFTVISHLDHGISGGHAGTHAFLSGVRSVEAAGMPDGNITLDQRCAEHVQGATRFPVLNTSAGSNNGGGVELSWTRSGVMVPSIQKVDRVFKLLFCDVPADQVGEQAARFDHQGSLLDAVMQQAQAMNERLSSDDRRKLDQYFTSIREVERTIQQERAWLSRPRPHTNLPEPKNGSVTQQLPILFELLALALQTDSTRVATIEIPGAFDSAGVGLDAKGYHAYSHHGKDPKLMSGMRQIERYQIEHLARFAQKLNELDLLDSTQILFGSGMGDGSAHTNRNLPILVLGGGYRHQTHLALPAEPSRRVPLSNLYLTMGRRFGIAADAFGHSTGTLAELA